MKALWSLLRHAVGAALIAVGVVVSTSADLTWKVVLIAAGGAVLPVLGSAVNPKDPRFGVGTSDS